MSRVDNEGIFQKPTAQSAATLLGSSWRGYEDRLTLASHLYTRQPPSAELHIVYTVDPVNSWQSFTERIH